MRKLLHGTEGNTKIVLHLDIQETRNRVTVYPWGLSAEDLSHYAKQDTVAPLSNWIVKWHNENDIPLVGDFTASLYIYSHDMTNRPKRPFWTHDFSLKEQQKRGSFAKKFRRGPFLTKGFHLVLLGIEILFPLKKLKTPLKSSLDFPEDCRAKDRALQVIKQEWNKE